MMKKLFLQVLCTGILAGTVAVPSAEAATIRVSEAKILLEIEPGRTASGEIQVENPTEEPITVQVYTEDWAYFPSGNGEKEFHAAETLPKSASGWITFNPLELDLAPFDKATVNYSVKVPSEGVEGTHHSVLFFETILGEAQDEEGANVLVTARLGSLFLVDIAGKAILSGGVETIDVTPPRGNRPAEFRTTFRNSGNTDIVLDGNVMILDPMGFVKGRGELNSIYTEGGMTVTNTSTWVGKLDAGTYDLVFTYDMGQGKSLVEERRMTVE